MPDNHNKLSNKLETVASLITEFLIDKEKNEEVLVLAEKRLTALLDDIKKRKQEDMPTSLGYDNNSHISNSGMLIINSRTEILRNSDFLNHMQPQPNKSRNPKLIDFMHDSSKNEFESMLSNSILVGKNANLEVLLKTGFNNKSNCLLEIDILSSNIKNDRLVVHYSFNNKFDIPAFDFESLVFENLPSMDIFLFDKEYRYILAGGKEKEKHKLSNSDFIGKKMFDVYDKQSQRRFFPFYNKAIKGERTEGEVRYKNEVYYIVAKPIKNHIDENVAGILVSQNVTKDKLLEETLIKSKEEAQKADKAKSIFLANMSHEIRTPLNAILGFTEQLNKTKLNEEQTKLVSLINHASDYLLYLVNEIVILFKIGMGKVYMEKIDFSIHELLDEIYDIFKKQANEKRLKFDIEIEKKVPKILKGDPYRLRQILMNLLQNAIKYTDEGYIRFTCKLLSETKTKSKILFEVSDTGLGIKEEDLPHIFDVFEQGNTSSEKVRGGAGLGLGICKKLVDLSKGVINVESQINEGSIFSVQIPFQKSTAVKLGQKAIVYDLTSELLKEKKILLADDDKNNLLLGEMILKGWKSNFKLVKDGKEAVDILRLEKFDLILLDIHMPKFSGVDVIKKLRSNHQEVNYSTPAIAITANVLKDDINRYLKAGFNDYVFKPFGEDVLYNKLCNILQIEPTKSNSNILKKTSVNKSSSVNSFNTEALLTTANGDLHFFNAMINNFIDNTQKLLEIFKSSIKNEDWNEIGEKAHKAIPSFKFFKLSNLSTQLEEIENMALKEKSFSKLPEIIDQLEVEIKDIIIKAKAAKK